MLSTSGSHLGITEGEQGPSDVPKQVRDRLGVRPGSKVDFEVAEDGRVFVHRVDKRTVKPGRIERMRGTATSGLTTDAIMALSRGEDP